MAVMIVYDGNTTILNINHIGVGTGNLFCFAIPSMGGQTNKPPPHCGRITILDHHQST